MSTRRWPVLRNLAGPSWPKIGQHRPKWVELAPTAGVSVAQGRLHNWRAINGDDPTEQTPHSAPKPDQADVGRAVDDSGKRVTVIGPCSTTVA